MAWHKCRQWDWPKICSSGWKVTHVFVLRWERVWRPPFLSSQKPRKTCKSHSHPHYSLPPFRPVWSAGPSFLHSPKLDAAFPFSWNYSDTVGPDLCCCLSVLAPTVKHTHLICRAFCLPSALCLALKEIPPFKARSNNSKQSVPLFTTAKTLPHWQTVAMSCFSFSLSHTHTQ